MKEIPGDPRGKQYTEWLLSLLEKDDNSGEAGDRCLVGASYGASAVLWSGYARHDRGFAQVLGRNMVLVPRLIG